MRLPRLHLRRPAKTPRAKTPKPTDTRLCRCGCRREDPDRKGQVLAVTHWRGWAGFDPALA